MWLIYSQLPSPLGYLPIIFLFSFTYLICLIFPFFFQLTVSQTSFSKFLLYPLEQESSVTFVCLTFLLYSFRLDRIFVLHSLLYQDRLYTFSLFFVIICFTSILSLCSMPPRLQFSADYCELAVCGAALLISPIIGYVTVT